MTLEELYALPLVVPLDVANRALGIGRTVGYQLARDNDYPIPVIRVGSRYRVTRAALIQHLAT